MLVKSWWFCYLSQLYAPVHYYREIMWNHVLKFASPFIIHKIVCVWWLLEVTTFGYLKILSSCIQKIRVISKAYWEHISKSCSHYPIELLNQYELKWSVSFISQLSWFVTIIWCINAFGRNGYQPLWFSYIFQWLTVKKILYFFLCFSPIGCSSFWRRIWQIVTCSCWWRFIFCLDLVNNKTFFNVSKVLF